jgi:hypothetical protein
VSARTKGAMSSIPLEEAHHTTKPSSSLSSLSLRRILDSKRCLTFSGVQLTTVYKAVRRRKAEQTKFGVWWRIVREESLRRATYPDSIPAPQGTFSAQQHRRTSAVFFV